MPDNLSPRVTNLNAERLKAEGNEFHQKGQYQAAYKKYTEAIKIDPKNAVYYANRAASSLVLKEYMDAAADAEKATTLDPSYAKAWGRLGAANYALSAWTKSYDAYKSALNCLPKSSQLEKQVDKQLREQFLAGIRRAEKALNSDKKPSHEFRTAGSMPWDKAIALQEEYAAAGKLSSAFVILFAYEQFKQGNETMRSLQKRVINGQEQLFGRNDALVDFTNAVMRDPRVFHMDSSDWLNEYNRQVIFECQVMKGWNTGGAKIVMNDAPGRLRREGWNGLRPALSITIRCWIMCGLMAKSTQRYSAAMEYYSRAVDVLDWGSHKWANVPTTQSGCIFERTFIRGVKRMRLVALQEYLSVKDKDCKYTKEDAAEWSRDLIAETDANPPDPSEELDAGFLASFWMYPKADALAVLAWYHMQLGLEADNFENAKADFEQSAQYYTQAAKTYPEDDEYVLIYLSVAFEAYAMQNKTLKDVMVVLALMDKAMAGVMKIWEDSPLKVPRDQQLFPILEFGYECMNRCKEGKLSLDDVVKPKSMEGNDIWKTPNVKYI